MSIRAFLHSPRLLWHHASYRPSDVRDPAGVASDRRVTSYPVDEGGSTGFQGSNEVSRNQLALVPLPEELELRRKSPSRRANVTASSFECTSSLARMFFTCVCTVSGL